MLSAARGGLRRVAHLNLEGTQHTGDVLFLFVNEKDVFQHDGSAFVAGMHYQATGPEQQVFKDVVDFLVNAQIRSRKPLKVAQKTVMVKENVIKLTPVYAWYIRMHKKKLCRCL